MTVSLIDIREVPKLNNAEIGSLVKQYDAEIVIVVGHGTAHSVGSSQFEFTAQTFPHFPTAKVVWLYACSCGRSLITEIAKTGVSVFGYITPVLAPATVESSVAHHIKDILDENSERISPNELASLVQDELFSEASALLDNASEQGNALLLLQASLINHTRLSLRFALPAD
jgi:hypothetical protein